MSLVIGPVGSGQVNALSLRFTSKAERMNAGDRDALWQRPFSIGAQPTLDEAKEESIYLLEGEADIQVEGRFVKGTKGFMVIVPGKESQASSRQGSEAAKVLLIYSPAGIRGLVEEISGQTDMDKVVAAIANYYAEPKGQPLEDR